MNSKEILKQIKYLLQISFRIELYNYKIFNSKCSISIWFYFLFRVLKCQLLMIKTIEFRTEIVKEYRFNRIIENNFKKVKLWSIIIPLSFLFLSFCFFVFSYDGSFVNTYVESQKNLFLKMNKVLSIYPNLAYNITQLGDALVIFPFVFIFLFIAPKFWEVLLTSSIFLKQFLLYLDQQLL